MELNLAPVFYMQVCNLLNFSEKFGEGVAYDGWRCALFRVYLLGWKWDRSTAVQIASSIQHGEGLVALSRFTIHTKNWVWVKVRFGGVKKQGHDVLCSLASHTLRREGKGLVTLQPSSCRHDRNLMWPIRSAFFVDRIHCHEYNYVNMYLADVSILLPNCNGQ